MDTKDIIKKIDYEKLASYIKDIPKEFFEEINIIKKELIDIEKNFEKIREFSKNIENLEDSMNVILIELINLKSIIKELRERDEISKKDEWNIITKREELDRIFTEIEMLKTSISDLHNKLEDSLKTNEIALGQKFMEIDLKIEKMKSYIDQSSLENRILDLEKNFSRFRNEMKEKINKIKEEILDLRLKLEKLEEEKRLLGNLVNLNEIENLLKNISEISKNIEKI